MIRPGIYRDRDNNLVHVLAADEYGVVLRYTDGSVVTVSR